MLVLNHRAFPDAMPGGFIGVDVFGNAQDCLTRIGDAAADITVRGQVHVTEKGSVFLIASIIEQAG